MLSDCRQKVLPKSRAHKGSDQLDSERAAAKPATLLSVVSRNGFSVMSGVAVLHTRRMLKTGNDWFGVCRHLGDKVRTDLINLACAMTRH
jgi:hypothetical protein